MRQTDLLFLATMAFAAAVASFPPAPRPSLLAETAAWSGAERAQLADNGLDPIGTPVTP